MLRNIILVLAVVGATYANGYGNSALNRPTETRPMETTVTRESFNPCTEEVMRAPEIQLFPNMNVNTEYLICTDVNTPISMPCSPGTVFDQNLRHCIPLGWEAPMCPVGTCFNNADCVIDELNQASCICRVGFTGDRCEVNIDECALGGNSVCAESSGVCVDQINAFYCEWNSGAEIGLSAAKRINRPCSLTDLEAGKQFYALECQEGNVFLQCTGEWSFIVTKCADMLFWHQELKTCSIERPLEKTGVCKNYPCRNDGTCIDLGGNSFRCDCKEGYMGDVCEETIDFCLNMPCQMGGRCVSHPGGFNCVCQDLIVDQSCATGVQNPCRGGSEYLPNNVDSTKYVSCSLGYGFVKSCAPGLQWNQEVLNCMLIEELMAPTHATKTSSYGSSYGSYEELTPVVIPTFTPAPMYKTYETQTPMVTPPPMYKTYETQTPMVTPPPMLRTYETQTPMFTPPPMVQTYETQTPMFTPPPMVKQSYGQQQRPTMPVAPVRPAYGQQQRPTVTPPPMVHQSYGQRVPQVPFMPTPAPMVQTYETQTPMVTPPPMLRTYETQTPMFTPPPMIKQSYGQQMPKVSAPAAKSYGQNFGSHMLSFIKN